MAQHQKHNRPKHPRYDEARERFTADPHQKLAPMSLEFGINNSTLALWVADIRFAAGEVKENRAARLNLVTERKKRTCNRCHREFTAIDHIHTCEACKISMSKNGCGMIYGYSLRVAL